MTRHLWLTLVLLLTASPALGDPTTVAVRIEASRGGTARQGTGFIVARSPQDRTAHLVTAQHVVGGAQVVQVFFSAAPFEPRTAEVLQMDELNDLALLRVDEAPPTDIAPISLANPDFGATLAVVGYPGRDQTPRLLPATFSGLEGTQLVLQMPALEGNSGGPVFWQGAVVGVVKEKTHEGHYTYAVPVSTLRLALGGWKVDYTGVWPGDREGVTPEQEKPTVHGKIGVGLMRNGVFSRELSAYARTHLSKNLKGERVVLLDVAVGKDLDEIVDGDLDRLDRYGFAEQGIDYLVLGDGDHSPLGQGNVKSVSLQFQLHAIDVRGQAFVGEFEPCAHTGAGGSEAAAVSQALGRCLDEVIENFRKLGRRSP